MGQDWHPQAVKQDLGGGTYTGGAAKILWHTTEGYTYPGPHLYNGTNPTFTFDFKHGRLYQHCPVTRSARALRHTIPAEPTNNDNVVQVELVGKAAESGQWTRTDYTLIADLARWIETNHEVPRKGVNFKTQARLEWETWHTYSGHVGHRHAPQNDHTDPGPNFRIDLVLAGGANLTRWRAELSKRRRQLVASKHPGQRHFLIRRIGELKRAIVRAR